VTASVLLTVLRYVFLAGLLLFVARVLRAVLADLDVRAVPAVETRRALVIEEPALLRGRRYPIAGEAMIGRAPECAIVLDDEYVSAQHARVYELGGRLWVEDLRSTNGTVLNGHRLRRPTTLRTGDRLQIGRVVLGFRVDGA
jgi:hypothetical protein